MDPYRTPPPRSLPHSSTATPTSLVLLVLGAWLALSTGAPVGKDFLLWGFTALLAVVIGYLWQREGGKR
jgi:VIT1/CCC1 family predicted Fe2+/Mn2+ transporter